MVTSDLNLLCCHLRCPSHAKHCRAEVEPISLVTPELIQTGSDPDYDAPSRRTVAQEWVRNTCDLLLKYSVSEAQHGQVKKNEGVAEAVQ